MKKKSVAALAMGLLMLGPFSLAEANWIDLPDQGSYGYFRDDVTGYTWMDNDSLTSMSPQAMQAALAGTGFKLATIDQICKLVADIGSTQWYGSTTLSHSPDSPGGQIIGATTNNAAWGYSSDSLLDGPDKFRVSLARYYFVAPDGVENILKALPNYQANSPASTIGVWAVKTDVAPVPEPATILLFGTGIAGLAGARRRRRK